MREKDIEAKLRNGVKSKGGIAIKMSAMFLTGIPDRLCLLPEGRLFFAELKSTGKELRPPQVAMKRFLEGLGFKVYKIDSAEQVNEILRSYE